MEENYPRLQSIKTKNKQADMQRFLKMPEKTIQKLSRKANCKTYKNKSLQKKQPNQETAKLKTEDDFRHD